MPNWLRNVRALVAGVVIGSAVNMALITLSTALIPPPAGVDLGNAESLSKGIHLFEPRHYVMPFLAHALGTLAGAFAAYLIAAAYKVQIAFAIGVVFLCGGVAASVMIPAPAWFIALDLRAAFRWRGWGPGWAGKSPSVLAPRGPSPPQPPTAAPRALPPYRPPSASTLAGRAAGR